MYSINYLTCFCECCPKLALCKIFRFIHRPAGLSYFTCLGTGVCYILQISTLHTVSFDASKLTSTVSISMTQSYSIFTVCFASEIVVRIVAKTRSFETLYMDVHPMHGVIP